jgi:acylphosphatase
MLRGIDQRITRRVLEERNGLLTVVAGRLDGKVTITVVGYQPGVENTKKALRERLAAVLDEFELTGVIV